MRLSLLRLLPATLLLAAASGAAAQTPAAQVPAHQAAPRPAPAAPALTPGEARQVLQVLQDPARRAQFAATLESMLKASEVIAPAPAASASAASDAASAPASPAANAPAPTEAAGHPAASPGAAAAAPAAPAQVKLSPDGLGVQLLTGVSGWLSNASVQLSNSFQAVMSVPLFWRWMQQIGADPVERQQIVAAAWRLVVVMACALAVEWAIMRLLRRLRRTLDAHAPDGTQARRAAPGAPELPRAAEPLEPDAGAEADPETGDGIAEEDAAAPDDVAMREARLADAMPSLRRRRLRSAWHMLRRLPFVLARLLIDLLPVGVFYAIGNGLVGTPLGDSAVTRLVILAVVQAYALTRAAMCVVRALVDPTSAKLRLLNVSNNSAAYLVRWCGRIVAVSVFGVAVADIAGFLGLFAAGQEAIIKLVSLVVHAFLVVMVLQRRAQVAAVLRARPGRTGAFAALRNRFAEIWHWVAIFYIVALWFVWAVEISNGFVKLVHFFAISVAVLVGARLAGVVAIGAVDRAFRFSPEVQARYPGLQRRAGRYYPGLRATISAILAALTALGLLQVWGLDAFGWLAGTQVGGHVVSAVVTIGLTVLFAVIVWEFVNAALDRYVDRLSREQHPMRAVRVRTLLPILRTTLMVTILLIVGLTVLSEIGVNIAPLLAGAGVVGVAIGFGSQTLVKDLITGLFLLLENAMQVGDWVTLAGLSGTVEQLSIRTIRLRASDGSIHIIPFSAVTSVTNTSRDFANASVSASFAYKEDTDRVTEALAQIGKEMRADPAFRSMILDDLAIWGVDSLGASAVTIMGQIKCTTSGRWPVQREFNRRIKKRFEALGIDIPFPTQTVLVHRMPGDEAEPGRNEAPARLSPPLPQPASAPP